MNKTGQGKYWTRGVRGEKLSTRISFLSSCLFLKQKKKPHARG
jgi:hypothetical protein